MTIDRLSSLSAQIAALRAEMTRKKEGTRERRTAGDVDKSRAAPAAERRDRDSLRRQLAEAVRGVSIDDAPALDNARRRIVRTVLLWEFGADLREYPEWQPMIDRIADSLGQDERYFNTINRLIADLQA